MECAGFGSLGVAFDPGTNAETALTWPSEKRPASIHFPPGVGHVTSLTMASSLSRRVPAALVALSLLAWAGTTQAQDAQAIYDQGILDLEAGKYDVACPALLRAYRIEKRPMALFKLAECQEKAGRIATAALHYDEYLNAFERLSPPEQRDEREREREAIKRRDALDKDIPRVTFNVPESSPPGTKVERVTKGGGNPIVVTLGTPLPIDPGEHFVVTEAPGRKRLETRIFVQKGDRKTIDLTVASLDYGASTPRFSEPLRPVDPILPPQEKGTSGQRIAAYVAGGIGGVGLILGIMTGAVAWSQKGVINDNCAEGLCNLEGQDAADLADATGTVSTVAFPIGLVGIAAAVVLVLTEPEPSKLGGRRPAVGATFEPVLQVGAAGNRETFVGARWEW